MAKFFSSDYHLFHNKVIEYCNRPFKDINEMHRAIINNINSTLNPEDELWILGDITMLGNDHVRKVKNELDKIKNRNLHLVLGNHDSWRMKNYLEAGFRTIHSTMWFSYNKYNFFLFHDPAEYVAVQNAFPNSVALVGHVHELFKHLLPGKSVINVGVDVWNFEPVSLDKIINVLEENNVGV